MAQIKIGDSVTVLRDGATVRAKVTSNNGGVVSVQLDDGSVVDNLQHSSVAGPGKNSWYGQHSREKLGKPGQDPNVIELA